MSNTHSASARPTVVSKEMHLITRELVERYMHDDVILRRLQEVSQVSDEAFASQRWLLDSPPKRLIFQTLYGDLLDAESRPSVLDVGGGYSGLSRVLLQSSDYTLLDLLSHDTRGDLARIEQQVGKVFLVEQDWCEFESGEYDVIVANDLFPNVDQRLELFIEKYLPRCGELRLALTYFNTPRWYAVRRMDCEEVLHVLAWSGSDVRRALKSYEAVIESPCLFVFDENPPSVYSNGRQVCIVSLRGGIGSR